MVAGANDEALGDLLDRHVLDLAHDEHGPKGERQVVDATLDDAPHFRPEQAFGRRFRCAIRHLYLRRVAAAFRIVEGKHDPFAFLAPQTHQRLVHHDARQPGSELCVTLEVTHVPECVQIRILQRVFGVLVVLENGAGDPEQPAVEAAHQRLERRIVPTDNAVNQVGVLRRKRARSGQIPRA